ncbi:MAG: rhodanese-like domain-containing protein [Bacteroidales bacterium]
MKSFFITILISLLGFSPMVGGNFFRNVKVKQADKLIREHEMKGDMTILDVRSPGEFANGYIKGAINIDFWGKGFVDSISKLDKNRIYFVYCASGVRSSGAMKKMRSLGFGKIYNMKRGMFGWRAAKLPVVISDK